MKLSGKRLAISELLGASALVLLVACSAPAGSGSTPASESDSSTAASEAPIQASETYSDWFTEEELASISASLCKDFEEQLASAERDVRKKSDAVADNLDDANLLRLAEEWARNLRYNVDRDLVYDIQQEATDRGNTNFNAAIAPSSEKQLLLRDFLDRCGLVPVWERFSSQAKAFSETMQDAAYLAATGGISQDEFYDRIYADSDGSSDESGGASAGNWYPKGYRDVGQGIAVKWLKPGSYECNMLVEWCWGMQVVAESECPNGLIIEIDIFDGSGVKLDTAVDSLGSLRQGEVGKLVLETFESAAQTAEFSSADCF